MLGEASLDHVTRKRPRLVQWACLAFVSASLSLLRIREGLAKEPVDLFVCGHSHICLVQQDKRYGHLHLNPGAAGWHGLHKVRTLLKFELNAGKIENLRVLELGLRSQAH